MHSQVCHSPLRDVHTLWLWENKASISFASCLLDGRRKRYMSICTTPPNKSHSSSNQWLFSPASCLTVDSSRCFTGRWRPHTVDNYAILWLPEARGKKILPNPAQLGITWYILQQDNLGAFFNLPSVHPCILPVMFCRSGSHGYIYLCGYPATRNRRQ